MAITRGSGSADLCVDYAFLIRETLAFTTILFGQKPELTAAIERLNTMVDSGQLIAPEDD